ncbi:MAG: ABC transporter substrate-binding protein [Gammaproteobacteria bacterium]
MYRTTRRRVLQSGAAGALALATPLRFSLAAKKGGVMRMGKAHGQTADNLDPGTYENGFMIAMTLGVHNYLTEVNAAGEVQPELAESWEPSQDAATWTFSLRKGVVYHNGQPLTAEDVIASINHHRREDSTSAAKPIVAPIKNISADGQHTVVFELEAGNADFPFVLSDYHLPIMPSKDGQPDWQSGIGAGAYAIKNFDPGVRLDLAKHADYWKSDRGHFDEIQMLTIVDPAARTNALITGQVDAIDRVDLKTVHLLKRRPGLEVHSIAGTQHYTFAMRTNVAPFNDNNVRMALKHAINREEMVEKILQGFGVVGNDHPIGPGQRFFANELEQRTYDPDKAKHFLKQAGLDQLDVALSSADAAYAGAVDAASLFAESAKSAGLNIQVVREPNDGYWSNVWNTKPFCAVYWGGRPTADWMFSPAYEAGVAWNDTVWEHEKFNKLLKEARAELDVDKRRTMYSEMQQIVRDEGGTIVPMFASYVFATSAKLGHSQTLASNWDLDGERWMERWWFA